MFGSKHRSQTVSSGVVKQARKISYTLKCHEGSNRSVWTWCLFSESLLMRDFVVWADESADALAETEAVKSGTSIHATEVLITLFNMLANSSPASCEVRDSSLRGGEEVWLTRPS